MGDCTPFLFLFCLHLCAGSGRPLDSLQGRVTVVTEATGNCTFEASPLLQSTVQFPLSTSCLFTPKQNILTSLEARSNVAV
jgi:hypothetical protein